MKVINKIKQKSNESENKMNQVILVNVTNQSGKEMTDVVSPEKLMFISGSSNVKQIDVIDWNVNQSEYSEVA